jgi:HK97 gp10 family phage protein
MIEVRGMDELQKQLGRLAKSLDPDEVEPVLMRKAEQLAKDISNNAPVGATGHLKQSVVAKMLKRIGNKPATAIAALDIKKLKAFYGYFIEYGTSKMSARPFFRPTVDNRKAGLLKEVVDELKTKVEAVGK